MRPASCLAALLVLALAAPAAAAPFEISASYAASAAPVSGTDACRSGLDMDTFTYTFDLAAGRYAVRGVENPEGEFSLDAEGTLGFLSGPFAPDDTAIDRLQRQTEPELIPFRVVDRDPEPLRSVPQANRCSGATLGEKAMRATLEWHGRALPRLLLCEEAYRRPHALEVPPV